MKVKLDCFYLNALINGLYTQRSSYDNEMNCSIDTLILRLVAESETMKTTRKRKLLFEPVEISIIRQCLFDWRNQQIQAEKEVAVELIGELLAMYI
jgi:hypothetical protein